MTYEGEFYRNMRETVWTKLFPHWWTTNDLIKVIGEEVERLKAEWLFSLLNAGIKPPVMLWKTDIDYKEFIIEEVITNENQEIEIDAPLYKTHGIIEIKNTISEDLSYLKIMINDEDGILINQSIKKNETLIINTEKQQFHIDDVKIKPTIYGKGLEYFKTSKNLEHYDGKVPLHNEILRLKFSSNSNNINFETKITLNNVVFITEQNIEITSIEILPIEKVELYVYYDFPFNQNITGWRKVYEKKYDEDTNVLADMITTQFYSQKYYVDVTFKAIEYPYKIGFPCYADAEPDSMYHVNTHLENWGELLGLSRRYYKKNIKEEDYPYTFPIFYPYDIEQDFWYYSRLVNEYCWNEEAIDSINLTDTAGHNVMRLHVTDPFVQDFVVHTNTIEPTKIDNENYNNYSPKLITQESSTYADYKQMSYIDPDNLLNNDYKQYTVLNLYQRNKTYINKELYKSKELDIYFDLSNLPKDIYIKGIEIKIVGESTDNSTEKYNDSRTRFIVYNDDDEIFSKSVEVTQTFGLKNETITYGGSNENFDLEDYYIINNEKIDIRDILVKNGLHFILTFQNDSEKQTTSIILKDIELSIYYEPKKSLINLSTKLTLDKNNNRRVGQLSATVKNIGERDISTYIDFFNEKGITLEKNHIPIYLDKEDSVTHLIDIYPEQKIINKKYQILTLCENSYKYNEIYLSQGGQIETNTTIDPFFTSFGQDIVLNALVKTINNELVSEGYLRFYIDSFFIGETSVINGEGFLNVSSSYLKEKVDNGLYSLEARYMGSPLYQPSREYTNILISKKNTIIKIISNDDGIVDKEYIFKAQILSDTNEIINNGKITFYINNKEICSSMVVDGEVEIPYIITQNEGSYILKAVFDGSLDYAHAEIESFFNIIGGEPTLSIFDITGAPGEEVEIIGKVINSIKNPITHGKISFFINDEKLCTLNVQQSGGVIYPYIIPNILSNEDDEKILEIKAIYEDDKDIYKQTTTTGIIKVMKKNIKINVNTVIASQYEPIGFLIKLLDIENNQPVTNGTINLIKNDEIFATGTVDNDGYCRICYNPITYLQEEFEKLNNFKFVIEDGNLIMLYPSTVPDETILLNNESRVIFNNFGIDFFLENGFLYIDTEVSDPQENIYINEDTLETITRINNLITLFETGLYTYDIEYIPDVIYKRKTINNNFIYLYDSNVDVDLLEYNLKYKNNQKIKCYISDYNGEEKNFEGSVNFYIDYEKLDNVEVNNNIAELILSDVYKYSASNHLLQAEYIPIDDNYTSTITSSYLKIDKINTKVEVQEKRFFLGEEAFIEVTINPFDDIYLTGNIQFFINNQLISSHYLIEEDKNKCIFNFIIPLDANENNYNYTIKYNGNQYTNSSEYTSKIISKKQEVFLSTENQKISYNSFCFIDVLVKTQDNDEIINDGNVTLKYNDRDIETQTVINNHALFKIYIDEDYDIGNHQFVLNFDNSKNFIESSNLFTFNIEVISPLEIIYIDSSGNNDNIGSLESPLKTLEQALKCIKDNGKIYIISDIIIKEDIDIDKNIKLIGFNNSLIFSQNININVNKILDCNNLIFDDNSTCTFTNNNILNIVHSIIPKDINIKNNGAMNINRNLFYGTIDNISNCNLDYNWWGSNQNKYESQNNILLKIKTDESINAVGEDIDIIVYFEGVNKIIYDLPSPKVKMFSNNGYFTNEFGYFINNEFKTTYFDSISEGEVYAVVDNEKVSLYIESYYKKTEIISEDMDIPFNYQVPLMVIVQSVGDIFYTFDKDNNIINRSNRINDGRVVFYLNKNENDILLGHTPVNNGLAVFNLFFNDEQFNLNEQYTIKVRYESSEEYFNSESSFNINIIDPTDVLYVSSNNGKNINTGTFNAPLESIQEAINRKPQSIYLMEGVYSDENITCENIILKKFWGKVIFENKDTEFSIFNIETGNIEGIEFKNNKCKSIFNISQSLKIENCIFDSNKCSDFLINCDDNASLIIQYSAIINNYNINTPNNYMLDYNWWGQNDIENLFDFEVNNWVIMKISSNKNNIIIDSLSKLFSFITEYRSINGDFKLNHEIPNRVAKFFTNIGSVIPIKDFTYHGNASTIFNGLESNNTKQLLLTTEKNVNYNNQDNIEIKCKVTDVYDTPIQNQNIIFSIKNFNIEKAIETDEEGIATLIFENELYEVGEYPISFTTFYNKEKYENWDTLVIKKPKIFLSNVLFEKTTLNSSILSFNATDSIGNPIESFKLNIFIENEEILNKNKSNNFFIKNGEFINNLNFSLKKEGKYKLTIKGEDNNYESFNEIIDLIIPEQNTYITISNKKIQLETQTTLQINIFDEYNNNIKDILDFNNKISLFKIEGNDAEIIEQNLILQNGICNITIPPIYEPGSYSLTIHFDGLPGYYKESSYYGIIDVGVNKVNLDSEELQNQLIVKMSDNIDLDFPVTDINNNPVNSGFFEIYINNIDLKEVINNIPQKIIGYVRNGRGILNHNTTYSSLEKGGVYSFEIRYYDDSDIKKYANTILKTNLTVQKYATTLYIDDIISETNTNISTTFDIQSELGDVYKGTLTAYYDNKEIGFTNLKRRSSYIDLQIPLLLPGSQGNITFEYYDDTKELESITKEVPLFVNKKDIKINIINERKYYYPTTKENIQLEIKDNDDNDIDIGEIQLYQDNLFITSSSVSLGICDFSINLNQLKEYNLNFVYKNNDYYNGSSYNLKIKTIELPIKDIVIEKIYEYDDLIVPGNTKVKIKLKIESDFEVNDGTILLYLKGEKLGEYNINSENKVVEFVTPNIQEGEYLLEINYINSDLFEDRINDNGFNIPITITKQKTFLLLDCPNSVEIKKEIPIKAYFDFDEEINGNIKFYLAEADNKDIFKYIGVSNIINNEAYFNYVIPFNISESFLIKGVFEETNKFFGSENIIECSIKKEDTFVSVKDIECEYNDIINIEVDCDEKLNGEFISLYLNDMHIGTEVVNNNKVIFEYDVIEEPGVYVLKAVFLGVSYLNPSEDTSKFTINKDSLLTIENNIDTYICSYINLPTKVKDRNNNIIDGEIIYTLNKENINPINYFFDSLTPIKINISFTPFNQNLYNIFNDEIILNPIKNTIDIDLKNINKEGYKRGEEINNLELILETSCECNIQSSPKLFINDKEINYSINNNNLNFILLNDDYQTYYELKIIIDEDEKFKSSEKIFNIKIINQDIVYVDEDGNNNNSGEEFYPVKTLSKAYDMINDNGIIYIKNGTFIENELNIDKDITIIGNNNNIKDSLIVNNKDITIKNVIFETTCITNNNNFIITNCNFTNNSTINTNKEIYIDRCKFNNSKSINIQPNNEKAIITNNTFESTDSDNYGGAIFSNNGNDVLIENNIFKNNISLIDGNSICILGKCYIKNNIFENKNNNSEIKIINGNVTIEQNIFKTKDICLDMLKGDCSANLNFWGQNDNLENKVQISEYANLFVYSWLLIDYDVKKINDNEIEIYPILNKFSNENEPYISEFKLNIETDAIFEIENGLLNKDSAIVNKDYVIASNINEDTQITMIFGGESIKVIKWI